MRFPQRGPVPIKGVRTDGATQGNLSGTLTLNAFGAVDDGEDSTSIVYDEVGIIDITAAMADYISPGVDISGVADRVGVFVPAWLTLGLPSGVVAEFENQAPTSNPVPGPL